jgi:flagellar motor switch protein FliG
MARERAGGASLAGVEKAAVLLLSLGAEAATDVLRHLGEHEVRQVSRALAKVRRVEPAQIDEVRRELEERLAAGGALAVDGKEFARAVVTRALDDQSGNGRRAEILAELEQLGDGASPLAPILDGVPPQALASLLESEHPQIAALILAHLGAAQAGAVLALVPDELQGDLVERLAHLETVPADLVVEMTTVLREQVKALLRPAGTTVGGPKMVAELMNHADKTVEARVFEQIEGRDPELVATIRNLMFTFEDCLKLDNRSMQTLLKEVAREDLLLALKTASPALNEKIFANVSSRAAEILREDMASAGPVRLKDVEAAQVKIIATLRDLEAEGKVVIAGSGKDDVLV